MALVAVTACHGGSAAPPPPPIPDTTTTAPPTVPTQPALDAYRHMWDAFVSAATTADPDAPSLRRYATGVALARIVAALYLDREQNQVILGNITSTPTADAEHSTTTDVHITDCIDTSLWLIYRTSGGLVDNRPGGPRSTSATVTYLDDHWAVSTLDIAEVGTC
jgi:hypothetical protein